ncbi:MAG TPA: hypothetical protein ENN19_13870 [Chloroflexi bacterium]|nr:hypothetical protein [Chloroflexota bacterium]
MSEERMQILQMLEDGKITADEATTLLRALSGGQQKSSAGKSPLPNAENRFLRVRVADLETNKVKVNVTLPMGLLGAGLRMAERFAPELAGFDMQDLEEMLTSGASGKIVEVTDEEDNELVEVYVE